MRMTKVTLEFSDDDWIFIMDSLIDRRDNALDLMHFDTKYMVSVAEQANRIAETIENRIAD